MTIGFTWHQRHKIMDISFISIHSLNLLLFYFFQFWMCEYPTGWRSGADIEPNSMSKKYSDECICPNGKQKHEIQTSNSNVYKIII